MRSSLPHNRPPVVLEHLDDVSDFQDAPGIDVNHCATASSQPRTGWGRGSATSWDPQRLGRDGRLNRYRRSPVVDQTVLTDVHQTDHAALHYLRGTAFPAIFAIVLGADPVPRVRLKNRNSGR